MPNGPKDRSAPLMSSANAVHVMRIATGEIADTMPTTARTLQRKLSARKAEPPAPPA